MTAILEAFETLRPAAQRLVAAKNKEPGVRNRFSVFGDMGTIMVQTTIGADMSTRGVRIDLREGNAEFQAFPGFHFAVTAPGNRQSFVIDASTNPPTFRDGGSALSADDVVRRVLEPFFARTLSRKPEDQ